MSAFVYLICNQETNTYKIGVSKNPQKRVKNLQTSNSSELNIIETYKCEYPFRLEKMLHNHYNDKRILNEWFELSSVDIKQFKQTCDTLNNIITNLLENIYFSKQLH